VNVAFFSNQFAAASGHGIAHYAHRLYEGLLGHPDLTIRPVATWSDMECSELVKLKQGTGLTLLPWGRKLTPLVWTFLNAPPVERWMDAPVDIVHMVAPGFPVATRKKLVVTVHDIGPITHQEYFSDKPWLFKRSIDYAVRHADAIICVSQATANELIGYAGTAVESRIQVIHEGVDSVYFAQQSVATIEDILTRLPTRGAPFVLAAGALSPRKNIERLLRAFERVKGAIPHHLVLVGGGGWDCAGVMDVIAEQDMSDRVHHLGYVTDDELRALYQLADIYAHPSLFEGFGLTILEAMAAGCPVITSNSSSLPEVAGCAASMVDPTSIESIGGAIEELALNSPLRKLYSERGLDRVRHFEWEKTAGEVAELYRAVAR
jgi:glycosyltransferase involved in cell wall biosynthesis